MKKHNDAGTNIVILCAALLLAGCTDVHAIDEWELASVTEQWANHGGISRIYPFIRVRALCRDGAMAYSKRPEK